MLVLAVAACINTAAQSDPVMRAITDYRRECAKAELTEQKIKRIASHFGYEEYRGYKFDKYTTIRSRLYNQAKCLDVIADNVRVIVDEHIITVYGTDGIVATLSRFSDIGCFKFDGVCCGRYTNAQLIINNNGAATEVKVKYDGPRAISFTAKQPQRYRKQFGVSHRSTARCRY
jgi:hypothetical protein